jgi:SLT domain-containing protein
MGQHHHTHRYSEKKVADLPHATLEALRDAMQKEGAPDEWFEDLAWIMAQQSEGCVDAENPTSTARGLFQLTEVDYSLLPLGKASFANAVEECQGGIRYIRQRYDTAAKARAYWRLDHGF